MGLGDLFHDGEKLAGDAVHVAKDIVMAPADIAHWALTEMFGGGEADLRKIAAELSQLSKSTEALAKDIESAVDRLTWHGPAADAFITHAHGRVKEMNAMADNLDSLSGSVNRLASLY
jgi:uncharacterized protein YukE